MQSSIAFYRERLGFQLDFEGPEGDVFYAGVSPDGIGIMLECHLWTCFHVPTTRATHGPVGTRTLHLDPDTLFDEFRQRGVPFVKELSFIDEGLWGFEITDADGYVLAFFQVRNK